MRRKFVAWALIAAALALYVRSAWVWHHRGAGGGIFGGNYGPSAGVGEAVAVVVVVTSAAWLVMRRRR